MSVERLNFKKSSFRSYQFKTKNLLRLIFFIFCYTYILFLLGCNNEQGIQRPAIVETTDMVESHIASLKDDDYNIRGRAAYALGEIGDARAVEPLIAALKDNDNFVRMSAALALGQIGDSRAVEPLIAALNDEYLGVSPIAARALDKLGWKAEDEQERVSYLIAKGEWDECVKIGNPAVEPLIAVLNHKFLNSEKAAKALGEIGDNRAVEPLIATLKDEYAIVRFRAAEALDKLGWKAEDEQERVSYLMAKDKLDECVKIGSSAVIPLINVLKYDAHAADALGRIGVEHLIALLKDDDYIIRSRAAHGLGDIMIKDERAVEPLINALRDDEKNVRREAARALGQIEDSQAVKPLINALRDDEKDVRKEAAIALGKIEDSHAVEPLINALRDDEKFVRREAAIALGEIGDIRATRPLTALLKDEYAVSHIALEALEKIGDQRAIPFLVPCLKDSLSGIRVANVLDKLGWNPQSIDEKVSYAVATRDESTLVRMWEQTKSVLLEDVRSSEYVTMENALYALIGIGREEVISNLIDILNSKGDKTMAEVYLNCGHKDLASAARKWAARNGYSITVGSGASPVGWGSW